MRGGRLFGSFGEVDVTDSYRYLPTGIRTVRVAADVVAVPAVDECPPDDALVVASRSGLL
jgi:hypothetical protein